MYEWKLEDLIHTLEELKADLFSLVRSGDIILVKASRRMYFDTLVPLLKNGPQP